MRLQLGGERGPDPLHALQLLQRAERSSRLAISDYPSGQRGADTWQAVEFLSPGDVNIDGFPRARIAARLFASSFRLGARPRGLARPRDAAAGNRRVDLTELCGERRLRTRGRHVSSKGAESAEPHAEGSDRGDEEERLSFGRGGHGLKMPASAPTPASKICGACRNLPTRAA